MNEHLERLEPQPLWRHFRTLCNTPRPSGHEAALVALLEAWADEQGLACAGRPRRGARGPQG